MSPKVLVIAPIISLCVLAWGLFVYLNFGASWTPYGDLNLQGWNHGLISGVLIPLIVIVPLLTSFVFRSVLPGIVIAVMSIVVLFAVSGLANLVYKNQDCPRPYTLERLEMKKKELSDPQKFLSDWKERYRRGDPSDTWEPTYGDYQKVLAKYESDMATYKAGCSGYRLNAERPETYTAFLASLVGDNRIPLYSIIWFIIFILPASLIGAFLGSKIIRKK